MLKQNHHRLEVAGKSMVGTAIRERTPRIAQNTSQEKQRLENPLLPYTRSEVALPLMVGERVLGALDVQSTKEADFGPEVIETVAGVEEFDARDRALVWRVTGGKHRYLIGDCSTIVRDDIDGT